MLEPLEPLQPSAFELWWATTDPVVRAFLRQRGCQLHDVDDLVQLTSEKAWRTPKSFGNAGHFVAWCCTVAESRRIDEWRKTRRETLSDLHERPEHFDIEDLALNLVTRDLLLRVIATLPPVQRDAVLGVLDVSSPGAANRVGVARHRARNKLRDAWERLLGGLTAGPLGRVLARFTRAGQQVSPEAASAVIATGVAAILGVLGVSALALQDYHQASRAEASKAVGLKGSGFATNATAGRNATTSVAPKAEAPVSKPNYSPVRRTSLPFLPASDGSPQRVVIEPSTPEKSGQHVCFSTMVTPYGCVTTPFQSIDYVFPSWMPQPLP